jgi:hypothetical protein
MFNEELLWMADELVKRADGVPGGGMPPPMPPPGAAPPPPGDPNAAMQQPMAPQVPGMDPMTAAMGTPQAPAQPAAGAAGPQKLKPEQMMQMIDMRMYNMQQQLTAIAHAVNAQIDMGALVLPPGMQGAPPAETAIPGGPMDPTQAAGGPAAGGGPPAAGPPPGADPTGGGMPPKQAGFMINGQLFNATPVKTAAVSDPKNTMLLQALDYILRAQDEN